MSGVLQYAVMHPFSVEIYRIIEGSGTLVTGGLLNLPLANPIDGDVVHPNMAQKAARQGRSKKATFRFATRRPPLV